MLLGIGLLQNIFAQSAAGGVDYICVVTPSGGVKCMGGGQHYQLGNNTLSPSLTPVDVIGLTSGVSAVVAGQYHTCALLKTGEVRCWGSGGFGQLGDGKGQSSGIPVSVALGGGAKRIAAGGYHTCAVLTTNQTVCWGYNKSGQLGDGTTSNQFVPVPVSLNAGATPTSLALGYDYSCARSTAGDVQCWGENSSHQLGRDTSMENAPFGPGPVSLGGFVDDDGMVAHYHHTCAMVAGGVRCWGSNGSGELGSGDDLSHTLPVSVTGLNGVTVLSLTAGAIHTCAVTATNMLCWGDNEVGQLGNNSFQHHSSPVEVSSSATFGDVAVGSGNDSTCALTGPQHELMRCWGSNWDGQFGIGTRGYWQTPTPASALVGINISASAIAAGSGHSCALTTANDVQCWGFNYYGELGIGTTDNFQPTPQLVMKSGSPVSASLLTTGAYHTCVQSTVTGTVQCWGNNVFGQLGDSSTTDRFSAVGVLQQNFSPVAASGLAAGHYHTCAIEDATSHVLCWGFNISGQVGTGTGELYDVRAQTITLASGVTTAFAIAAGGYHTCIVHNTVQCWGSNSDGQLGVPIDPSNVTPTDVPLAGGAFATAIVAGESHTCALTTAGAVQCWGRNISGQLGQGNLKPYPTPTPVGGALNGLVITAIAAGENHTCALTLSGDVWCWGSNNAGQVGNNSGADPSSPLQVKLAGVGIKAAAITAGFDHTCAITTAGDVQCWGGNEYGQLGNGEHGSWPEVGAGVNVDRIFADGLQKP